MESNQTVIVHFGKKEAIVSLIIGELIAWLSWPIVQNNLQSYMGLFWMLPIVLPILSFAGSWVGYEMGKKILVLYQFVKFVPVGMLNTCIDLGVLNLFFYFFGISKGDWHYPYFKGVAFLIASTNSYFWNRYWSFSERRANGSDKKAEFAKFLTVSVIVFAVNLTISSLVFKSFNPTWISVAGWGTVSAIFGVIFSMVANFLGYKFVVFKA